jgi:hypothetical protein
MSYLKDREIWLSSVPTGNPPAGYVWVFIQNGVFVVRDSNGIDKIMATTTGTVTNATSASYVEYSNVASKPALISGSSQVSFNGITDKPALVSSSAQIVGYNVFATTGSNQFNGSQAVTGSLTVTGQVVAQTLNVQQVTSSIVYSSGSNIFGNSLGNTQQFTGSVSVTGSLTVAGAGTFVSSVTAATLSTIGTAVAGQNVQLNLNGVSGKAQRIEFQNSGVQQWLIGAGAANETNNFEIYNSNGQMALSLAKATSAATFVSSVAANSTIVQSSGEDGAAGPVMRLTSTNSNAGSRNWAIINTWDNFGDITFRVSNAKDGNALSAGSSKMVILSSGNVGIGLTGPQSILHLYTATSRNIPALGTAGGHQVIQTGAVIATCIGVNANGNYWIQPQHINDGGSNVYNILLAPSGGRVGIRNSDPQGVLEAGIVANNTTQGGHLFSTFQVPLNTWTTVFYAPNNNWAAITEFTWVSSADYNRSGAAYMRWAYNGGAAALGVVYTLFNDSQNSTATFRNSGGEIQILITGGASDYYVQVRIQGSKAA